MSTNQEIIDRALIEASIIESGQSGNAQDLADSMTELNGMMFEWRESGRDINWFSQDTLSETCPIPDWSERGVVSNLAVSLCSVFRVPISRDLGDKARKGLEAITRTLFNLNLEQADMSHLPQGRDSGRNILTDS